MPHPWGVDMLSSLSLVDDVCHSGSWQKKKVKSVSKSIKRDPLNNKPAILPHQVSGPRPVDYNDTMNDKVKFYRSYMKEIRTLVKQLKLNIGQLRSWAILNVASESLSSSSSSLRSSQLECLWYPVVTLICKMDQGKGIKREEGEDALLCKLCTDIRVSDNLNQSNQEKALLGCCHWCDHRFTWTGILN